RRSAGPQASFCLHAGAAARSRAGRVEWPTAHSRRGGVPSLWPGEPRRVPSLGDVRSAADGGPERRETRKVVAHFGGGGLCPPEPSSCRLRLGRSKLTA